MSPTRAGTGTRNPRASHYNSINACDDDFDKNFDDEEGQEGERNKAISHYLFHR